MLAFRRPVWLGRCVAFGRRALASQRAVLFSSHVCSSRFVWSACRDRATCGCRTMMDFGGVTFEEPTAGPVEEEEELTGTVHDRLQAIMRSDFEHQLRDNPEFATQVGFHEHDSRLQDCSPAAFEMRLQHNERVLAKFAALDLQDPSVNSKDRLHVDLLRAGIQGESDAIRLNCHTRPINSIGGMGALGYC